MFWRSGEADARSAACVCVGDLISLWPSGDWIHATCPGNGAATEASSAAPSAGAAGAAPEYIAEDLTNSTQLSPTQAHPGSMQLSPTRPNSRPAQPNPNQSKSAQPGQPSPTEGIFALRRIGVWRGGHKGWPSCGHVYIYIYISLSIMLDGS